MLFGKKSAGVDWLLVCLGNPGRQYESTRHNMGFQTADLLAERLGLKINKLNFRSLTATCQLAGQKVLIMKPQTYMNLSGEAVQEAVQFYKLPAERVLVIYDDVSLPVGKIRVRPSGSAGGHNGIKNITLHLGTDVYPRVKIGVGSPEHPEYEMVDWVIGTPSQPQRKLLREAQQRALDAAECLMEKGVNAAMNQYN